MIGGYDFIRSDFNRAIYAKRQPGSAFKPIIYATALEHGFTPASVIVDEPATYQGGPKGEWSPENYDHKFYGPTRLREALTYSRNVVTVKLLEALGINKVIDFARSIGIQGDMPIDLTLALGSLSVSPLDLALCYSVFANSGMKVNPIAIKYITDSMGRVLESNEPEAEETISPLTAFLITSMMDDPHYDRVMVSTDSAPPASLRDDARTIGLIGLAHGASHFFQMLLPPLFPLFIRDFGLSWSQVGLLVTVFFVVSGIGQALAGFLVDRVGARPVLYAALGLFIASALAAAGAPGYGGLMLSAVLAGLGNAPFHPVDFTILNHRVSQARLGHAFSVHGVTGNLGWAAAPVFMAGLTALSGSWRIAYLAAALLGALVLAAMVWQRDALDARSIESSESGTSPPVSNIQNRRPFHSASPKCRSRVVPA